MIKAVGATSKGSLIILGLSRENCTRLLAGLPIHVDLHELDPRLPEGLTVLLMGGETEEAIAGELQQRIPPQ